MTRTEIRPSLGSLVSRSAPPSKIYATPTWSRFLREDSRVEYTISVPTRFGGRLFVVESFDAAAGRADVAARIRAIRRVLWGRDNPERALKAAWVGPATQPASAPDIQPSETPKPEEFAAAPDSEDGDAPPWNVEAAAREATPALSSDETMPSNQDSHIPQAAASPHPASDSQMSLF